jgi:predicted HicB family RNase H-like nuclease
MAVNFTFESNLARTNAKLAIMAQRQIPFAASKALNRTGVELLAWNKIQMRKRFDNPVRYTVNAFRLVRSKKSNLVAEVRRKDRAAGKHYLEVQQDGGQRPQKGFERKGDFQKSYKGQVRAVLPTKRTANRGSNVSMAWVKKALAGINQSKSSESYPRYFVAEPGTGKNRAGGIYRVNAKKGKPQKLFTILDRMPRYNKRLPFTEYMTKQAKLSFPKNFRRELRQALRTARFR